MTRILIADDHDLVRTGLRNIVQTRLGGKVTVAEAKNAQETIEHIGEAFWDLVLLDINMPGRDGLEVLQESRRLQPNTSVLMLTASSEEGYALRALELGAAGFLTKESASAELITALHCILAGGRYVTASLADRLALRSGEVVKGPTHQALSHRELQVLRLLAAGKTNKQIAVELTMSEKIVATYSKRIFEKTGMKTQLEISQYAFKHGLSHKGNQETL